MLETLVKILKFLLVRRVVMVPLALLVGGYWLASCASVYVSPAQLGVRQVYFGSNSGIRKELLSTGMRAGQNHLERDPAFECDLLGKVDNAHAAASQLVQDLVAWDGREGPILSVSILPV